MQINTNASTTLPLNSKSSSKSISTPERQECTSVTWTAFTTSAEKSRELELRYAEIMTGLKGEEALSKHKKDMEKTMALMGPETREHYASPAELEKQMKKQADSIFRSPAGEILAVVYKDGTIHTQGEGKRIDFDALSQSAKGLSEHEYRAAMRNGIAAALGSRAVASYYDYNKPAPTMREIHEEERIFYSRG